MSKEETTEKLKEMGFNASLENGVVMVTVKSDGERSRVRQTIKELELRGSWGMRGEEANDDNS